MQCIIHGNRMARRLFCFDVTSKVGCNHPLLDTLSTMAAVATLVHDILSTMSVELSGTLSLSAR